MAQDLAERDTKLMFLALCGVAAPIVFAVLVLIGGLNYEGYSHATQAISELGGVEARYPLIQNVNFFALGILVIALAFGLHQGIAGGKGSIVGPVLVGVFGVSSGIANAFLPCDAGCEFETLTGAMHNLTGLAGFIAAIAASFVISRRLRQDPRWQPLRRFSLIMGAAAAMSLLLWIGVAKAAEVDAVNGTLQRLFVGVWFVWIEVMALRLFYVSRGLATRI